MITINSSIDQVLNQFTQKDILSVNRGSFESFHIFSKLEDRFKDDLNNDELLYMYYNMKLNEDCLNLYRKKLYHVADLTFQKIMAEKREYNPLVSAGMKALFHSMVGYREYALGNFEEALANMRTGIEYSELQGKTFPFYVSVIAEQWLNIVRVYIAQKKREKVIEESIDLFLMCLTSQHKNADTSKHFDMLDDSKKVSSFFHVSNSIYRSLMKNFKGDAQRVNSYFKEIIAGICQNQKFQESDTPLIRSLRLLNESFQALEQNQLEFVEHLNEEFGVVQKTSLYLQKIILENFVSVCQQLGQAISPHPNYPIFQDIVVNYLKSEVLYQKKAA
ncbi:MAG: hypothetical protein AAF696_10510 [Bacteroidota bacterium]